MTPGPALDADFERMRDVLCTRIYLVFIPQCDMSLLAFARLGQCAARVERYRRKSSTLSLFIISKHSSIPT